MESPVNGLRKNTDWNNKVIIPKILIEDVIFDHDQRRKTLGGGKDPEEQKKGRPKSLKRFSVPMPEIFLRSKSHHHNNNDKQNTNDVTSSNGHLFINHQFKKATFCDVCHRLLVGYQRQGLRCKICKGNIHSGCVPQIDECQGSPMGSFSFNRQLSQSSPKKELNSEPKVDSVYQVLKEGNLLRSLKESNTSSPIRANSQESTSSNTTPEPSDRCQSNSPYLAPKRPPLTQQYSDPTHMSSHVVPETNRLSKSTSCLKRNETVDLESRKTDKKETIQPEQAEFDKLAEDGKLFVALYKYEAQQRNDISLKAGDVIKLTNDHNETWWTGTSGDKTGFFPANFVMRIRPTEQIYSCVSSTTLKDYSNKEIQLKRNQIVLVRPEWQTDDVTMIYTRSYTSEGLVRKEDLNPV